MGVQLLDKTRKINKLLHNNSSSKVVFNDICEVLTEILDSNVLVISKKGKVLGGSKCEGVPYITELIEREIGKHVDDMLNERLLSILSTKENVNLQTLGFSEETVKGYQAIITPIDLRCSALLMKRVQKRPEKSILYSLRSAHCLIRNWRRSFIYLMNWMEPKESLLQVRLQIE